MCGTATLNRVPGQCDLASIVQPVRNDLRVLVTLSWVDLLHTANNSYSLYSSRQKWCPESEAGLFKTIVEHTAAELFDAATQDRSTTDTTMRVGVDRRAKRPQR